MKLLLSLVLSFSAFGSLQNFWESNQAETLCKNIRVGNNGQFKRKILRTVNNLILTHEDDGQKVIMSVEGQKVNKVFNPHRFVRDIIKHDGKIWALNDYSIELYEMDGNKVGEFNLLDSPSDGQYHNYKARDFALLNGMLYVAHSTYGLVQFDMDSKKVVKVFSTENFQGNKPTRSMVVAVGSEANGLYTAITRATPNAFQGIAYFDGSSSSFTKHNAYNERRMGVVGLYPTIHSNETKVILNNGGWVHVIEKSRLKGNKKVTPKWIAMKESDDEGFSYSTMVGDITVVRNMIYGCSTASLPKKGLVNNVVRKSL